MGALRGRLRKLKLNQKLTLAMFGVVLVPVALLTVALFGNMQSALLQDRINDLEASLRTTQADLEKAVELCNLTTQFFVDNAGLTEFLGKAARGDAIPTHELIDFYREDMGALERLVAANPYLYQVRIYQPEPDLPEIMPILYNQERMRRLAWGEDWTSGQWQLDYDDVIFTEVAAHPARHIMSLVTALEDRELGGLGVLEVAVRMDEVLPGLYRSDATSALLVGDACYTGDHDAAFWAEHGDELAALFDSGQTRVQSVEVTIDGERALVAAAPVDPLEGRYLSVLFYSGIAPGLMARSRLFLVAIPGLLALLILLVNLLVKAMLRRFYVVVDTVAQVREGHLNVQVPDVGEDEIGALGIQLGRMLDRIQALMQENVDRQLLAKNAEIKALQSQINTHFIYNVLESIKMLAEVDERYDIADALNSLGKLLRYSMRWTSQNVTLLEEIDHINNYLALINLRFDYRIDLHCDVPDRLLVQSVPKMILQPIVENAVVHGIEELARDTRIEIRARQRSDKLFQVEVTDYGKGIPPERLAELNRRIRDEVETGLDARGGIGLKNVHDRIVMSFGGECRLWLESEPGRFTRVLFRIPMEEVTADADEHGAGG